ncbi:MAG: ATPase/histidine kinase/DNA gyrase B/HSP90 domain protein [Candidatus Gottesmanbacteria bacterium GW2011_GWB1_43_11]|uniref:histidine kinase n=1 Tax=Candidatus Gottesmanbacteria bacterium GW2011_GWB1_43_11 TaxID=1618446 RepID=A0A0G1CNT0_9BACT|nr:MAG: ATPase/histidine kinase/DNA gyrase B/HSP90 domain protein [Candidatus Gottesmanbacteria bacterium GW2011_GWA2_42_16]KKS56165.1 MAG: ATPase/histidine kinase/DNA gyrase B/HSP90 domain protein [Candidatus Gottesmanbacteria bacterium GW2011_GWA1_42_26]KKS82486.1 MAG: ATPase/histidine kinase/DNA gyrase B/HSP90 domain protein [Candidatus Gottesmanbacteria bacterium GW2011_GWC1_43_10]KKS87209.1 MAG: ATPase/histidine kinase/DNA gyrase B/HSP90 domain protein [Candidatus Gottesmanbacteria bacteriu
MKAFQTARIKLTLWYIAIIALLLTLSSLAAVNAESQAFNRIQQALGNPRERPKLTQLLETRIAEFEFKFQTRLLALDIILFIFGSIGSYFLSGITLDPIQEMIKKQEEFAADASHELRTPLTTIAMEIEALKRTEKKLPSRYIQVFKSVQAEVARMKQIVDGLLTVVRGESSDAQKTFSAVDLLAVSQDGVRQMQKIATEKEIELTSEGKPVQILGNPEELKQVVLILLDNALKYTPPKGQVKLNVLAKKRQAEVTINDTGYGIPESDLPHIFERFYRVLRPQEISTKGAGLGLAIAQKIVDAHHGKISVASQINQGTRFTLSFPTT